LTDQLTEEIERTVRNVLDESSYRTPDERPIDDITTVDHCQSCGLMPAPVILTDGDWECYNCGRDPNERRVIWADGGWVDTPETTFCSDCQRERISCAHERGDETEGSR
jgi:hypothetical protein